MLVAHEQTQALSWSALIATYRRPEWVVHCVRHALAQTVPPDEIVVVAAEGDESTSAEIFDAIPDLKERVRFEFLRSPRGSTVQRNAGLAVVTSDLCVLVDDDLYLAPDFMEHVLAGFAADDKGELAAIQGEVIEGDAAHVWFRSHEEGDDAGSTGPGARVEASILARTKGRVRRFLWPHLFRYIGPIFPPEQVSSGAAFSDEMREAGLVPAEWLRGGCTAFRTGALGDLRFNELFADYAAAEDVDLSVRIGRRHAIARCPAALGYHLQIESGRPDTPRITFSALLNIAYTARTVLEQGPALRAHILRHHRRFARSWALMGALAGRGLSEFRAARLATDAAVRMLDAPDAEVEGIYRDAVRAYEAGQSA